MASFSNGDPPLNLAGDSLGNYSATWQPGGVNANMVVTLNATLGSLQPATAKLYGGIAPNQTPPPTLGSRRNAQQPEPSGGRAFGAWNHRPGLWLRAGSALPSPPARSAAHQVRQDFRAGGPSASSALFLEQRPDQHPDPQRSRGHPTAPHHSQRQQRADAATDAQHRSRRARRIVGSIDGPNAAQRPERRAHHRAALRRRLAGHQHQSRQALASI